MIVAVVLAAGKSARMGRPKQTLLIGGIPMLQKVIDSYRSSKVDRIVVVFGAGAEEVRRGVKFRDETLVVNERYEDGMSGSIKVGLAAVAKDAEAALIALGDQPYLRSSTIDAIVEEYRVTGAPVVVPVYHGQRGNPVLFDRSIFPEIMKLDGDVGAKSVVRRNESRLREIAIEDRGIVLDLDTPADYESAKSESGIPRRKSSQE